jgi:hypothetical protein
MKVLQEALDSTIKTIPEGLVADLLGKKLADQGVHLSRQQCEQFARQAINEKLDTLELPWWRFWQYRRFRRSKNLLIEFTDDDSESITSILKEVSEKILPELVEKLIEDEPKKLLATLQRHWKSEYKRHRRDEQGFRRRLQSRWGVPIQQLRMLLTIAQEFGDAVNNDLRCGDMGDGAHLIDVLTRLHARACQITSEVECLLAGGFSDGAMARWRSLHEVAVVAQFISKHGAECAERYTYHQFVGSKKAANNYQRCQERLGYESMTQEELEVIGKSYRFVLDRYGAAFREQYGWARPYLSISERNQVKFSHIEEAVGVDHLRAHYQMASHNVHANPKGVFFKMGLIAESEVLLAGASNAGLTEPGHATALSLIQASSVLMKLNLNLDSVVMVKVMMMLADEIGKNLLTASEQLDRDDARFRHRPM